MPKSKDSVDATLVQDWASKRKKFSTQQVADAFECRPQQAAAAIAIMRIKGVVERGEIPSKRSIDQTSRWEYIG